MAIDEIDKSISHLHKKKEALLSADQNLRLANDKSQHITIKRLTKNNQTMAEKLAEIRSEEPIRDMESPAVEQDRGITS